MGDSQTTNQTLTVAEFTDAVRRGQTLPGARVEARAFLSRAQGSQGEGEQPLRIVLSTGAVARDNHSIDPHGWVLDDFARNPVVTWQHDIWWLPVGRAPRTLVEGDELVSYPEFPEKDVYDFGHMVGRMLRGGFLNAASIMMEPLEYVVNEERGGIDFRRQALLSYGITPLGVDPGAVVTARSVGIDIDPLRAWAQQFAAQAGAGVWLSQQAVERALAAAGERSAPPPPPPPPPSPPAAPPPGLAQDALERAVAGALENLVTSQLRRLTGRLD